MENNLIHHANTHIGVKNLAMDIDGGRVVNTDSYKDFESSINNNEEPELVGTIAKSKKKGYTA